MSSAGQWLLEDQRVLLASVAAILVAVWWFFARNGRKLPPGPYGLPFVGYLPFMTDKPYLKFQELQEKYGPIFSIKLGSRYVVVLCDYYAIKEAFSQDAFMGRPPDSTFNLNEETIRLGAINGIGWKEQRRFAMSLLRDLGFGKSKMEQHIIDEITDLLNRIKEAGGKPISISTYLAPSVSNNISSLVFGKRRKFDDPKRIMLDNNLRTVGQQVAQAAWHSFFPWVKAIAQNLHLGRYRTLTNAFNFLRSHVREEIAEHKNTLDRNNVRDFIDGYLLEIEKQKNDPKTCFKIPVLEDQINGFFGAGSVTIRDAMAWLLLVVAAHPDVQKKLQDEIDHVIGKERMPSKADQKLMPYMETVTMETMRWRTQVPVNILRYTLQDTHVQSYYIPKHSYVIANLWSVEHDKKIWGEDAEEFKPNRFLSEDGKKVVKSEFLIPFSIGKRSCPGESLAITEIFLYFSCILQKFTVKLPHGAKPDFEGELGIGLQPKPYQLIFELRS